MAAYLIAFIGGGRPETEEEGQEVAAAWGAWFEGLGDAVIDGGNPFGPSMSVATDGTTSEGGRSKLGGYSLFRAGNLAAASELVKDCPQLKSGGTVEVYEIIPMD